MAKDAAVAMNGGKTQRWLLIVRQPVLPSA
jgi:hypothetical protein